MGTLFLFLTHTDSIYKQIVLWIKADKIEELLDIMKGPLFNQEEPDHKTYLLQARKISHLLLQIYNGMAVFTCSLWVLLPFILHLQGKPVEFAIWLPFDVNANSTTSLIISETGIDQSLKFLPTHGNDDKELGMYNLQKSRNNLFYLTKRSEEEHIITGEPCTDIISRRFRNMLQHHVQIVHFAQEVEDIFSTAIAYQFLVSGWIICTSVYRMVDVRNKLQTLAQYCENAVLSELIKSQVQRCNVNSSIDKYLAPKCLMFFDINQQLCKQFAKSKYDLQSEYTAKMNEIQNVQTLCEHARSWKPKFLQEYSDINLEAVFKNSVLCLKLCADDVNYLSVDSNFFCKYYMWGTDTIKNPSTKMTHSDSDAVSKLSKAVENPNNLGISEITQSIAKTDNTTTITSENEAKQPQVKPSELKTSKPNVTNTDGTTAINQASTQNTAQKVADIENSLKTEQSVASMAPTSVKNDIEKPPVASEQKDVLKSVELEDKDVGIDNSNDAVNDDDQDDEEDDEHQYDQDGTGPKPLLPDVNVDTKNANGISDIFPNSMEDSFNEDDDHFFPFFLAAIIIVVLLYILYHNKNKVTKVILGLIVEGRQPGKRRNSRGHAYRRLDTLEQAMNTNTAAPPNVGGGGGIVYWPDLW
ncbi:unnamed protein product, partial [Brenthis ino]